MASDKLSLAWEQKLRDAQAKGGADVVVWLPDEGCWGVASISDPTTMRRVHRRNPPEDRVTSYTDEHGKRRTRGQIWWFFKCDCPAEGVYFFCWHKAAVVLWCKQYRNYDPRVYPLDTQRNARHLPNPVQPAPEQVATILQVAGPATDQLRETWSMREDERYLDSVYGQGTFNTYVKYIAEEGPAEAQAWLATQEPIATTK
jgi:hypothetical protein